MADFASRPPSEKSAKLTNFFRGGMMPAAPRDVAALIVLDIRSLNLTADQGRELENSIRDHVAEYLAEGNLAALEERSALDLSGSVFGIAIE